MLASAGADGSARIWNVSGQPKETTDLHRDLAAPWYRFDSATQEAVWAGDKGEVKVRRIPCSVCTGLREM